VPHPVTKGFPHLSVPGQKFSKRHPLYIRKEKKNAIAGNTKSRIKRYNTRSTPHKTAKSIKK
jgi:hypothetical protein